MKFYPALDGWFRERFPEFSVIQKKALPHTNGGPQHSDPRSYGQRKNASRISFRAQ
jgi:hypothetical protein